MNLSYAEQKALASFASGNWLTRNDIDVPWYSSRDRVISSLLVKGLIERKMPRSERASGSISIKATGGAKIQNVRVGTDTVYPENELYRLASKRTCPHCLEVIP